MLPVNNERSFPPDGAVELDNTLWFTKRGGPECATVACDGNCPVLQSDASILRSVSVGTGIIVLLVATVDALFSSIEEHRDEVASEDEVK